MAIKLQLKNVSSLNRTKRHVLPTPESPINIIFSYLQLNRRRQEVIEIFLKKVIILVQRD